MRWKDWDRNSAKMNEDTASFVLNMKWVKSKRKLWGAKSVNCKIDFVNQNSFTFTLKRSMKTKNSFELNSKIAWKNQIKNTRCSKLKNEIKYKNGKARFSSTSRGCCRLREEKMNLKRSNRSYAKLSNSTRER